MTLQGGSPFKEILPWFSKNNNGYKKERFISETERSYLWKHVTYSKESDKYKKKQRKEENEGILEDIRALYETKEESAHQKLEILSKIL